MSSSRFATRAALVAGVLAVSLSSACASAPRSAAQTESLNDPRMLCARTELNKLGYEVDESFRRPGRIVATKLFPYQSPRRWRAAILAEVDSTDKAFDMWSRVLPPEGRIDTGEIRALPPVTMVGDAMEVANKCEESKDGKAN